MHKGLDPPPEEPLVFTEHQAMTPWAFQDFHVTPAFIHSSDAGTGFRFYCEYTHSIIIIRMLVIKSTGEMFVNYE